MAIGARIIGGDSIEKALVAAFHLWAEEDINGAHWDDQFKEEKWKHSPLTIRENGEPPVGSPRDIYDLGALYESGVKSLNILAGSNGVQASWHWNAKNRSGQEYAEYVHEGPGTNAGYPRPFTDDIRVEASFFRKSPGMAFTLRVTEALRQLNAS